MTHDIQCCEICHVCTLNFEKSHGEHCRLFPARLPDLKFRALTTDAMQSFRCDVKPDRANKRPCAPDTGFTQRKYFCTP
jgi:hypothetical protein